MPIYLYVCVCRSLQGGVRVCMAPFGFIAGIVSSLSIWLVYSETLSLSLLLSLSTYIYIYVTSQVISYYSEGPRTTGSHIGYSLVTHLPLRQGLQRKRSRTFSRYQCSPPLATSIGDLI